MAQNKINYGLSIIKEIWKILKDCEYHVCKLFMEVSVRVTQMSDNTRTIPNKIKAKQLHCTRI